MSSPFLGREPDWVASNELAFALRDGYPVTTGHTLVIPKREIATWFEATADEQRALMDLVQTVKHQLDQLDPKPDGYNVGFNHGEAAGQTVFHLHIHVIPRYRGDMDDPRGGVRHVIPSKGNYKKQQTSPLSTGGDDDPFLRHLRPWFARAHDISIVAAFVQQSGLFRLNHPVMDALARGARVRIVTGDYLNITQAEALEELLDWTTDTTDIDTTHSTNDATEDADAAPSGTLEARVIETAKLKRSFHPKSWRFESREFGVAFVGSSNVSLSALERGIEWNLRTDRDTDGAAYQHITRAFEALWHQATILTPDWVRDYARRTRERPQLLPPGEEEPEDDEEPKTANPIQEAALADLAQARRQGRKRGLVVLATGLGKTWLAAFDIRNFADELGRMPRVLFVAHRREILRQAARTLRAMRRDRWPEARVGWFAENRDELDADFVVASVQKLVKNLDRIQPEDFDYVIVDEVHHATARSYRNVLDKLDPGFVLGLTATPERFDEADVLGLLDDNLVHRTDIGQGIDSGWLVPFDYFGLKDDVDYANIPWQNKRFKPDELARAVQTEQRMERMWQAWHAHPAQRTLVFCASIAHATYVRDWLAAHDVTVHLVHSEPGSDDRDLALESLARGDISAICSVDILGEGVDVPEVDRVIMLRPTESPVVFLQQLGRGLRKPRGDTTKERLTVIDFVGNHRVFLERVRQLLSLAPRDVTPTIKALLDTDGPLELPSGCSVDVELEAKDLLRALLPRGRAQVELAYDEIVSARDHRPTAGELQRMGYNASALWGANKPHASWFDFVAAKGHLTPNEQTTLEGARAWLQEVGSTALTQPYKMVVLQALLESGNLRTGMPLDELARKSYAILHRTPELLAEVPQDERYGDDGPSSLDAWVRYWNKWPVAHWTNNTKKKQRTFFHIDNDRLVPDLPTVPTDAEETLDEMTRELVDYRFAKYRQRDSVKARADHADSTDDTAQPSAFDCKVLWNKRDPILKLPSRNAHPIPSGETEVHLPDGSLWRFRFMKEFCNVARPVGRTRNELPDLMRTWFGPSAGHPGMDHHVRFERKPNGWHIERLGQVIPFPERGRLVSFPTLRAAAGAATGDATVDPPEASEVSLPTKATGDDLFAVRAAGDSMDGGRDPIKYGDWLIMRYARGVGIGAVEGRVVLVQTPEDSFGTQYQVKRVVRDGSRWLLRSDNPDADDYPATADTTPIALLAEKVRPEDLAPPVGTMLRDNEIAAAFGLSRTPSHGERVDGHLFVMLDDTDVLIDLATINVQADPGETAFVMSRPSTFGPWQHQGLGRRRLHGWAFER